MKFSYEVQKAIESRKIYEDLPPERDFVRLS